MNNANWHGPEFLPYIIMPSVFIRVSLTKRFSTGVPAAEWCDAKGPQMCHGSSRNVENEARKKLGTKNGLGKF
jgi:hypothetical protein